MLECFADSANKSGYCNTVEVCLLFQQKQHRANHTTDAPHTQNSLRPHVAFLTDIISSLPIIPTTFHVGSRHSLLANPASSESAQTLSLFALARYGSPPVRAPRERLEGKTLELSRMDRQNRPRPSFRLITPMLTRRACYNRRPTNPEPRAYRLSPSAMRVPRRMPSRAWTPSSRRHPRCLKPRRTRRPLGRPCPRCIPARFTSPWHRRLPGCAWDLPISNQPLVGRPCREPSSLPLPRLLSQLPLSPSGSRERLLPI